MPMVRNRIWVLPRCLTAPRLLRWSPFYDFPMPACRLSSALYARELDFDGGGQYFLLCYAIFLMICRTFTGNICDKKGRNMLLTHACWLTIGLVARAATLNGSIMMIISGGLIGIGYVLPPVFQTQINQLG